MKDPKLDSKPVEYLYRRERELRRLNKYRGIILGNVEVDIIFEENQMKLVPIVPSSTAVFVYNSSNMMLCRELGSTAVRITLEDFGRIDIYFLDIVYRNEVSRKIKHVMDPDQES